MCKDSHDNLLFMQPSILNVILGEDNFATNMKSKEVAVRPTLAAWCSYWDIEVLSTVKKK
jgi:hypothetical protein